MVAPFVKHGGTNAHGAWWHVTLLLSTLKNLAPEQYVCYFTQKVCQKIKKNIATMVAVGGMVARLLYYFQP